MIDFAHIHPMMIHFPLALLPVGLAMQFASLVSGENLFGRAYLSRTGFYLLVLAACGAIVAAFFGDVAFDTALASGVPLAKLEGHEELGMLSAFLISALAVFEAWFHYRKNSSRAISWSFMLAGAGVFVVVLITAWFGGNLVYELGVNVARIG